MKCNAELRGGYSYLHGVLQLAVQPFAARQTVRRLLAIEVAATLRRPASPSWFAHLMHDADDMPANAMPISARPNDFALDDAMSTLATATVSSQRSGSFAEPERASNPAAVIDEGSSPRTRTRSLAQTITEIKSSNRVLAGEPRGKRVENGLKQDRFPANATAQPEQAEATAATSLQVLPSAHEPMRLQKGLHALMQSLQQHNFPPTSEPLEPNPNTNKAASPRPGAETRLHPSVQNRLTVNSSGRHAATANPPTVTMPTSSRPASDHVIAFSSEHSETELPLAVLDIPARPASTFAGIPNTSSRISTGQAPSAVQRLSTAHDKSVASADTESGVAPDAFSKGQQQQSASQTPSAKRGAQQKRARHAVTQTTAASSPVTAARQMPSRFWQRSHLAQLRLLMLK